MADAAALPAMARARQSPSRAWLKAIELTARIEAEPHRLLADVVDGWAEADPDRPALLSRRECFSYGELAARINRYARWALDAGIDIGDTVCLLMPTRPEYLAAWLGITRIGGVVALINTQLVGASLAHCLSIAKPKHIIVAHELLDVFESARPHLGCAPKVWIHGGTDASRLDLMLEHFGGDRLSPSERRAVSVTDRALLIYTSGTTGLPKAAVVSHRRVMGWASWFAGLTDACADDRIYNCLPLYHSVGGVVAAGSLLIAGGSVVLKEKFSARQFWDDVVEWDCTLFQYIGELCRYLLKAPACANENRHRLRLCCGNGLRGDVWDAFKARFAIPQIIEFYAATEGNFSLFNVEGKPGAIGRIPPFLVHRFPVAVVRHDIDAGMPVRDAQGCCIPCAPGETGEAIGRIGSADAAGGRFEGYTDAAETEKKVLRNVFAPGDSWFRTGDLMLRDKGGFFYFVDRIGDTFRWKGENVAASEVADAIAHCPGVVDACVYGVAVPGVDGRAGMAALVVEDDFDLATLRRALGERLPAYARPLFIRVQPALALTETFKQKKQDLIGQGFDPVVVADPLYFDDAESGMYRPLETDVYIRIVSGYVRL